MTLVFSGKLLQASHTIDSYKIGNGDTIHCIFSNRERKSHETSSPQHVQGGARGFDRLRETGISAPELVTYRRAFHNARLREQGIPIPSSMEEMLRVEEEWMTEDASITSQLQGSISPGSGGSASAAAANQQQAQSVERRRELSPLQQAIMTVVGLIFGYIFHAAAFLAICEIPTESTFKVGVLMGVAFNLFFSVIKVANGI
jgi:hypothetical protein